jgi:hypothetical protein
MAPQTDEFGTKVGLLAGLVLVCAVRPFIERLVPEPKSAADQLRAFGRRLISLGDPAAGVARRAAGAGLALVLVVALGTAVVLAGTPARGVVVDTSDILGRVPVQIDPETLPPVTVDPRVTDFLPNLGGPDLQAVIMTMAENLELENQALLRHDPVLLTAVDHGDRLVEMKAALGAAVTSGRTTVRRYLFDSINVSLLIPFGQQDGFSLGMQGKGTVTEATYDAAGTLLSEQSVPFDLTFAVRRATGARWLNVSVAPTVAGS